MLTLSLLEAREWLESAHPWASSAAGSQIRKREWLMQFIISVVTRLPRDSLNLLVHVCVCLVFYATFTNFDVL